MGMILTGNCVNCGGYIQGDPQCAGELCRCPHCGALLRINVPSTQEAVEAGVMMGRIHERGVNWLRRLLGLGN
jgi:hypothetical protein